MDMVEKLKKKLKRKAFLYEHCNNLLFAVGGPPGLVYLFLAPFFPYVGLVAILLYSSIIFTGGFDVLLHEEKRKQKLEDLQADVDALVGCSTETLTDLDKEIEIKEYYIKKEMDVKKNKHLIQALIERKRLVKQFLEENGKVCVEQESIKNEENLNMGV